jgi:ribosome-binding protein aMBF1 (putative translation factor)
VKCIICGQETPQYETEMSFFKDTQIKICHDCFDLIAEAKKNRR